MKEIILTAVLILFGAQLSSPQEPARKRAEKLGLGMNLSYLEHYWRGTKEKNFADFLEPAEAARREKMFADIAAAGFATVRIPAAFGAWANYRKPFRWNRENGLKFVDNFLRRALASDLHAIIDLHHVELDGSIPGADATDRIVWLWREIALRYKDTDPERVFFEIRNEPHGIPAEKWRKQAGKIIRAIRRIAPRHTLIVGFHDWNSRPALIGSEPFRDENIIYTFHYYDPFIYTHQGATWAGVGLAELRGVDFPYSEKIEVPETARGGWVENLIKTYDKDSGAKKMFADLKAAKDWSEKHGVPIFLGEFGSYAKFAPARSRCRHAKVVYTALGKLAIPNAWWEWDGGFSMFAPGTEKISDCMREAVKAYQTAGSGGAVAKVNLREKNL